MADPSMAAARVARWAVVTARVYRPARKRPVGPAGKRAAGRAARLDENPRSRGLDRRNSASRAVAETPPRATVAPVARRLRASRAAVPPDSAGGGVSAGRSRSEGPERGTSRSDVAARGPFSVAYRVECRQGGGIRQKRARSPAKPRSNPAQTGWIPPRRREPGRYGANPAETERTRPIRVGTRPHSASGGRRRCEAGANPAETERTRPNGNADQSGWAFRKQSEQ